MKRSHLSAALSIVVHAVVAAIVAMRASKPPEVLVAPPPVVRAAPSEVIEVDFLDPRGPAAATASGGAGGPPTTIHHGAHASSAIEATSPPVGPSHGEVHASPPPVAALPSIRVSADRLAETIASTPISRDDPVSPQTTFDVHVSADGNVHITDRPNLQGGGRDRAVQREVGRQEAWLEAHHEQSNAIEMKMPRVGATVATFDVTDWAMRTGGRDPYASAKLKALDATREARAQLGADHRDLELVEIPALVRASLDEIKQRPAKARKAALVELWRDCDDSKAGELARATIKAYVADPAFTDEERAAFPP